MIDYLERMETALGRPPFEAEVGRVMAECAQRETETRRKRGYQWDTPADLSRQHGPVPRDEDFVVVSTAQGPPV